MDCRLGPRGRVWYLAGTTGGSAVRSCTVPRDRTLFFPLVNSAFVNEEGDCERPEGCTVQEKRDILDFVFGPSPNGLVCDLFSSVDGVPTIQRQIVTARTQSRPFRVVVKNNVLLPAGIRDDAAVSDGHWVKLPALRPGKHEVRFGGASCDPDTGEVLFDVDVTYHLKVRY